MGLNGVEVSPHGLIFDEDGATPCPMPLEDHLTPFGMVLMQFSYALVSMLEPGSD